MDIIICKNRFPSYRGIHIGPPTSKLAEKKIGCKIFKSNNNSYYRPIALTSVASKLLEHIMHSHVMKHLGQHNILTDSQHGFRAKRSTETQLILTIRNIFKSLDKKETVDMAILDFTKAFDKLPHKRLIHKLNYYGITGNIATWIETFLTGRTQQVVVNGATSSSTIVTSGVPQGTVLWATTFPSLHK